MGHSSASICGMTVLPGTFMIFPQGFEHEANYLDCAVYMLFPVSGTSGSRLLVRQVEEWIRSHDPNLYQVGLMHEDLGYSRRSFFRAFKHEMGLTPAQYLIFYRLSRAREDLAQRDGKSVKVSDIVGIWGFGDHGRFAGRYKNLFGEHPSKTAGQ